VRAKLLFVCLLVGLSSACESLTGPDSDDWYIQMELQDAHSTVHGIAAAPKADSKRTAVDVSSPRAIFRAENMWIGFSFPFYPARTTSLQLFGEYDERGGTAVTFSGIYAARLDVTTEALEHFDFAQSLERETDAFGFFVIFSPAITSGEAMVLTRARCVEEGEAVLTLKWADLSFSSNGALDNVLYRGEARLLITCSRKRP